MSETFTIRVGDQLPRLFYKFPFSLADAVSVTFSAYDPQAKEVFINRQAAIIANGSYTLNGQPVTYVLTDGVVIYPWAAADTVKARKGVKGLFQINWPGSLQETLPSDGFVDITIAENF